MVVNRTPICFRETWKSPCEILLHQKICKIHTRGHLCIFAFVLFLLRFTVHRMLEVEIGGWSSVCLHVTGTNLHYDGPWGFLKSTPNILLQCRMMSNKYLELQ